MDKKAEEIGNILENTVVSLENTVVSLENTVVSLENTVVSLENTVVSLENTVVSIETDGEVQITFPLTLFPCGSAGLLISAFSEEIRIHLDCLNYPMIFSYGKFKQLTIKISSEEK